ncbi:ABC transporter substrate-binding protein [Spirochaetia bacterium]|nr:ABC transporter substrate-binding protein [Spirochaetia bacterium]
MKKLFVVLFIALMVCGLAFGQRAQPIKIGIAVPTADHGWTGGIGWWADETVKELKKTVGNTVQFRVVHSANATQQVSDVENLRAWGMNILVILPHESGPLTAPVKRLHSQGIKCIVVDRGLDDKSFGYVDLAGDNPGLGRYSGQWLAATMKAEGLTNYVAMGGMPVVIDTERMNAFFAEMNKERSLRNLLGGNRYEFANWSVQDGLRIMETFLQRYPKIDAVFCQDDDVITGVMQAIKESGRTDIKIVLGGAGSKVVYKMIMDGNPLVRATTLYNPTMIRDGINYAADVARGFKSDGFHTATRYTQVVIPSGVVDKNNVRQFYNPKSAY